MAVAYRFGLGWAISAERGGLPLAGLNRVDFPAMKILVVASEAITAADLRSAVGTDAADAAEVLVIAPALSESPLRFWLSDADDAIGEAQRVERDSVSDLAGEGIAATGDTGDADPLEAVEDTLRTFPADRIVIFSHADGDQAYREHLDPAALEQRVGLPTTRHVVGR